MSEFTNNYEKRAQQLADYMIGLSNGENGMKLLDKYQIKTENFIPSDVVSAFDIVMEQNASIDSLKIVSNKLFNILFESLNAYPSLPVPINSFLYYLIADNTAMQLKMKDLKAGIKQLNHKKTNESIKILKDGFEELACFIRHYVVVENVIFPYLEKHWKHYRCVQLMWSFHDDIRRNLQIMNALLNTDFDLKDFNTLTGQIFFNINTIILREEKIIVPVLLETADAVDLNEMLKESATFGLAYVEINSEVIAGNSIPGAIKGNQVHLPTGILSVEQLNLIFNHMPVDITFVNEDDEVKYFSNPSHRIFPRTPAIVGRKVQFCHPPESVHIVNRIVDSFKSGEKDVASFWLHLGPKYVLIQYFAVRNEQGKYKGTLEVSQDITEIQKLEGDRKLLDW